MNRFSDRPDPKKVLTILRQDHYVGKEPVWEAWNYIEHRVGVSDNFEKLLYGLRGRYSFVRDKRGNLVPLDDFSEDMARKTSEEA